LTLVDKVIKNTFYNFLAQIVGYLFPFFLIPIIIGKIGQVEFGIYAIAYGFIGAFTLFDLGVSTSFIKFVSEYYYRDDYDGLNCIVNIGVLFYFCFTVLFWGLGYIFSDFIINYINIPAEAYEKGRFALHISLFIFFIATNSNMFVSILISLQKMYITSLLNIFTGLFNFVSIVIVLYMGYGIYGLLYCQLITVFIGTVFNIILAKKYLPQMAFGIKYFKLSFLKKMTNFGLQMQVSKLGSFISEKYDEFLLGFFSVISNVTYFNVGNRIVRFGKFIPSQFIVQVAPVAAGLNAKGEKEKLETLFSDTTKYLILVSAPVFIYLFVFSNILIEVWIGPGYEISSYIIRILILGQLINMAFSAPGNSITPNIGLPKYQMNEGLIYLGINLVASFFLIKYYGIVGAAIGNTIATFIASLYVLIVSVNYFNRKYSEILFVIHFKPIFYSAVFATILYYVMMYQSFFRFEGNRLYSLIILIVVSMLYLTSYLLWLFKSNYLNGRDKEVLRKIYENFILRTAKSSGE